MKAPKKAAPAPGPAERPSHRTPRVAAARRVSAERPQRMWSLLLPPRFDSK